MSVDHRPYLARKAPLIRRVLFAGLGLCTLAGGLSAGAFAYLTTKPQRRAT